MILLTLAALFTPVAADTGACNVPPDDDWGEEWVLVQGNGFTFCVPRSWKPVDKPKRDWEQEEWRTGMSTVQWKLGKSPGNLVTARGVVTVTATTVYSSGAVGPPVPVTSPSSAPRESDTGVIEMIDGQQVRVWNEFAGGTERSTGAAWKFPVFYFAGRAQDQRAAQIQMTIYRSVRLTTRPDSASAAAP